MSRQRSVAQQNAITLAEIRQTADRFAAEPEAFSWLSNLLQARGLAQVPDSDGGPDKGADEAPLPGILACLASLPDQAGELFHGIWLSTELEFWAFSVLVPYAAEQPYPEGLVETWVERFDNVTAGLEISAQVRGTGQSFAYLALQVLGEMLHEFLGEPAAEPAEPASLGGSSVDIELSPLGDEIGD